jgi:2-oxoglutarate ferredoxin oxidoreductase subunit delta
MEALQKDLQSTVRPAPASTIDYSRVSPLKINLAWCKGCDICSALCPRCVLEPDMERKPVVAHPEECTQCGICWMHCPDFAITSNFN